jgi:hypothetical protein
MLLTKIANAGKWSHLSLLGLDEGRAQKCPRNSGPDRTLNVLVDLENRREVPGT